MLGTEPPALESEDFAMLESIVRHFSLMLNDERTRSADLRRQLDIALDRVRFLESSVCWPF